MKGRLHLFLIIFLSLLSFRTYGAGHKKRISKSQIRTKHFDIVFDSQHLYHAERVANNLEYFYDNIRYSLNTTARRFTIYLNGDYVDIQSAVTNAPPMMEVSILYPQTRSINTTANWVDLVPIHETRHIFQNDIYYNYGFGKILYLLLGNPSPFNAAPKWFYEGDAVFIESVLSKGGRGRSSDFLLVVKAMALETDGYNYDKFWLGSHNNNLPDPYSMGYVLTTYLRKKFGKDIIERIMKRQSSFPHALLTFDLALYKETGQFPDSIYHEAVADIRKLYQKQLEGLEITDTKTISSSHDLYCDYLLPHISDDDSIIALKNGSEINTTIVKIKDGKESLIKEINLMTLGSYPTYHYRNDLITWSGMLYHPRWNSIGGTKQYSDIYVYDIKSNKTNRITKRGKYHSPNISPDGKYIVAVKHDRRLRASIVVIDIKTRKVAKEVKLAIGEDINNPVWSRDGSAVYFIKGLRQKNSLSSFTINDDNNPEVVEVIAPTYSLIDGVYPDGRYIYYHSDISGISNIYVLDRKENRHYQVTSVKYGAFNPVINKGSDKLFFNNFTIKGREVASISIDKDKWIPLEDVEDRHMNYFEEVSDPLLITGLKAPYLTEVTW